MSHALSWPRPPSALVAARLHEPHSGARVSVAGLVLVRQRPGTAKGVVFLTLEDETGVVNVVIWRKVFDHFRRAVIAGRMLRVTGRIERQAGVVHLVAEEIEDISALLDRLSDPMSGLALPGAQNVCHARPSRAANQAPPNAPSPSARTSAPSAARPTCGCTISITPP
ncbi:MAG: hypothetical protein COW54_01325 [Rhodobacteraceae bacterium CG17_big_fil_post_rev_8_21_14_2_50_63_15]|nr:hypothetical protein [Roseovarius sp.]PIV79977.1 MAG: hypothetical protein COW54_01325 [Rhodobacteraceae bacterium CG17_big_fil_post_rev_8_21_14_2_50_63_15]